MDRHHDRHAPRRQALALLAPSHYSAMDTALGGPHDVECETSAPKEIPASGRGRCRTAGYVADCASASLSDAASAAHCTISTGRSIRCCWSATCGEVEANTWKRHR